MRVTRYTPAWARATAFRRANSPERDLTDRVPPLSTLFTQSASRKRKYPSDSEVSGCSAARLFYRPGSAVEVLGKRAYDPKVGRGGDWRSAAVVAVEGENVTVEFEAVRHAVIPARSPRSFRAPTRARASSPAPTRALEDRRTRTPLPRAKEESLSSPLRRRPFSDSRPIIIASLPRRPLRRRTTRALRAPSARRSASTSSRSASARGPPRRSSRWRAASRTRRLTS